MSGEKKEYGNIYFVEADEYAGHPVYHCKKKSNDDFLGKVMWEDEEKECFCFVTPKKVWFSPECLQLIQDFLYSLGC